MYSNIKTYQDLCNVNVKFLRGEYDSTAYHGGPICEETIQLVDDLCIINKMGVYTFCGQPSDRSFSENLFENKNNLNLNILTCYEQRGYLDCFVNIDYIDKIKKSISEDIYYYVEYPCGKIETNIQFVDGKYRLHREAKMIISGFDIAPEMYDFIKPKNWEDETFGACISQKSIVSLQDEIDLHLNHGIKLSIFKNLVLLCLVNRDFNSPTSIEKFMIQVMSN
jgi:hypothetical protein